MFPIQGNQSPFRKRGRDEEKRKESFPLSLSLNAPIQKRSLDIYTKSRLLDKLLTTSTNSTGKSPAQKETSNEHRESPSGLPLIPMPLSAKEKREIPLMNPSSDISIPQRLFPEKIICYKYSVGNGNNEKLVQRVLNSRPWWRDHSFSNGLVNLKWAQTKKGFHFERLTRNSSFKQIYNHFPHHAEVSTKIGLFSNLFWHSEKRGFSMFNFCPITFGFNVSSQEFEQEIQEFFNVFGLFSQYFPPEESKSSDQPSNPNDPSGQSLPQANKKLSSPHDSFNRPYLSPLLSSPLKPIQKSPNSLLAFGSFSKKKPVDNKLMIPAVYRIKHSMASSQFFKQMKHSNNLWVFKPSVMNRGRGVEVFDSIEKLRTILRRFAEEARISAIYSGNSSPNCLLSHTFVVQKYIENPMLFRGRKFDIRVWVLVTHEMKVYFFREGYIRTSSEKFSLEPENISNKFMHLTNNAVQKTGNTYGAFEQGNQVSFPSFQVPTPSSLLFYFDTLELHERNWQNPGLGENSHSGNEIDRLDGNDFRQRQAEPGRKGVHLRDFRL